jgi:hypothetical protein
MIRKNVLIALCTAITACIVASGTAQAGLAYTLSNVAIDAYNGNPPDSGLIIQTQVIPTLPATLFTLSDGQSQTFDLFKIWTNETSLNLDDLAPKNISVTLTFSSPASIGTVGGTTEAFTFFGFASQGVVTWNPTPVVVQAPGVTYSIQLSDASFNNGGWDFGSFKPGERYAGTVEATIRQITSVPEPSSFISGSLGTAMLGGVWYLRRRRRADT